MSHNINAQTLSVAIGFAIMLAGLAYFVFFVKWERTTARERVNSLLVPFLAIGVGIVTALVGPFLSPR